MIESLREQEREELVKFLKERSIFRLLDDQIIHGLSLSLAEKHCGPGHIVFKEATRATDFISFARAPSKSNETKMTSRLHSLPQANVSVKCRCSIINRAPQLFVCLKKR